MGYSNAIPIGVIVGLVTFIIVLVILLRWINKNNDDKEARERDIEEPKNDASRAFDDGASVLLTPVASPRDALFNPAVHQQSRVMTLYDNPRKAEMDWNAEARRVQSHHA